MHPSPRATIASVSLVLAVAFMGEAAASDPPAFECGRNFLVAPSSPVMAAHLPRIEQSGVAKANTNIVLDAGPGLQVRPAALAAWNRAVDVWEAVLEDPITVTIEGDFASLGSGILGSTSPTMYAAGWNTLRNAMVSDAGANESVVAQIPAAAQLSVDTPPNMSYSGNMSGTRANLSALGFDMNSTDLSLYGSIQPDATMVFSTGFESQFDYDSSDGISPGRYDFEAIVVHEIGHALGFLSEVDAADYYRDQGATGVNLTPNTLDAFRLRPNNGNSFNSTNRLLTTGDLDGTQVVYDGSQDLSMSTGVELGDGRQASHWKADELSGSFLGIMDPTLAPGQHEELGENDVRLLALMGWDAEFSSTTPVAPVLSALSAQAHPNPFNPSTTLRFELPQAGELSLAIYDLAGRRLLTLAEGSYSAGTHELSWQGRDERGRALASGVYHLLLQLDGRAESLKLTLVK